MLGYLLKLIYGDFMRLSPVRCIQLYVYLLTSANDSNKRTLKNMSMVSE